MTMAMSVGTADFRVFFQLSYLLVMFVYESYEVVLMSRKRRNEPAIL